MPLNLPRLFPLTTASRFPSFILVSLNLTMCAQRTKYTFKIMTILSKTYHQHVPFVSQEQMTSLTLNDNDHPHQVLCVLL